MAMGSMNEVVAALDIAYDNNNIHKPLYDSIIADAEIVIKQLSNLSKKLKSR